MKVQSYIGGFLFLNLGHGCTLSNKSQKKTYFINFPPNRKMILNTLNEINNQLTSYFFYFLVQSNPFSSG